MCHYLALKYPHLDATSPIGGKRRSFTIINVSTQCMKRHTAFAVPFGTGDLGTAKTAGAVNPDALCAEAHGRLDGALHGAAEADATLQLLRDVLGDQLGVDLGLADLDDVQADLAADLLRQVGAQTLDVLALLADDQARTASMDGDAGAACRTLDDDAADAACLRRSIR